MTEPWMVEVISPYIKWLVDWMHARPGCRWDKEKKVWLMPIEFIPDLTEAREKNGGSISLSTGGSK